MREIQQPVVEEIEKGPIGGQRVTHPAFASIRASRVSGNACLYDSDFQHQHYVTVTIMRSELQRSLSNDWHHGREELIEVSMSESQWSHFVSSMNVGSGAPCTLSRYNGKLVPGLPSPKPMPEQFSEEIKVSVAEGINRIRAIQEKLNSAMGITAVRELRKELGTIESALVGTTKFIADQFDEHVERTVDRAKTEINAYALNHVVQAGLEHLGVPTLQIAEQKSLDKPAELG